jgi:hypothetical protein
MTRGFANHRDVGTLDDGMNVKRRGDRRVPTTSAELMFQDGTTVGDYGLVRTSRRGGATMRHVRDGYVERHSEMLAIVSLVAIVFLVGSGIYYLGESIHAQVQPRIFAGPVSTI